MCQALKQGEAEPIRFFSSANSHFGLPPSAFCIPPFLQAAAFFSSLPR
jgi:hypothetical protein